MAAMRRRRQKNLSSGTLCDPWVTPIWGIYNGEVLQEGLREVQLRAGACPAGSLSHDHGPKSRRQPSRRASVSCAIPAGASAASGYFTAKKSPAVSRAAMLRGCYLVSFLASFGASVLFALVDLDFFVDLVDLAFWPSFFASVFASAFGSAFGSALVAWSLAPGAYPDATSAP